MSIKLYKDDKYKKIIEEDIFFKYVKAAFANKRKNLLNNFTALGISKDELRKILSEAGIKETERAENLTIEDFINLIAIFEKK